MNPFVVERVLVYDVGKATNRHRAPAGIIPLKAAIEQLEEDLVNGKPNFSPYPLLLYFHIDEKLLNRTNRAKMAVYFAIKFEQRAELPKKSVISEDKKAVS